MIDEDCIKIALTKRETIAHTLTYVYKLGISIFLSQLNIKELFLKRQQAMYFTPVFYLVLWVFLSRADLLPSLTNTRFASSYLLIRPLYCMFYKQKR